VKLDSKLGAWGVVLSVSSSTVEGVAMPDKTSAAAASAAAASAAAASAAAASAAAASAAAAAAAAYEKAMKHD